MATLQIEDNENNTLRFSMHTTDDVEQFRQAFYGEDLEKLGYRNDHEDGQYIHVFTISDVHPARLSVEELNEFFRRHGITAGVIVSYIPYINAAEAAWTYTYDFEDGPTEQTFGMQMPSF
jgi:hypothetical protein